MKLNDSISSPAPQLIAIGDIHGCLAPLKSLITELAPTKDDALIFLGDYVDRGPDSKGVIDYLLHLREQHTCLFLMGNHELEFLDYLSFGRNEHWERQGGDTTLESYSASGKLHVPESHLQFLSDCAYYYETPDYFFVHGGLKPHRTIAENLARMTMVDLAWERSHLAPDVLRTGDYAWEKTVVCGHTPQPHPIVMDKLISIDTGCVYNVSRHLGMLTAIKLPSREIVQISNRTEPALRRSFLNWMLGSKPSHSN